LLIPMYLGASISISPSLATNDILDTLQKNSITIIIGVPRLYAAIRKGIVAKIEQSAAARMLFRLAKKLQSKPFSKTIFKSVHTKFGGAVEYLVSGGAALDPAIGGDFQALGFEVLEGYGMTEAAPMITFTQPGKVKIGSPGQAMHGTDIQIIDGEITASGSNIMKGYYNRPEETAEVLKDGRLFTGDLGYVDKDGYLFITGRKKEIIVLSNGKNVNPSELEEKLLVSELVKDCGVFYESDQLQLIVLPAAEIIVGESDTTMETLLRKELLRPYNESASAYKKINRLHITNTELPRTRLGKLQRFKLADLAHKQVETAISAVEIEDPVYQMIVGFLEKEKDCRVLPTYDLETDIGMDSLDKVSFQTWISQTFGVVIEPSEMTAYGDVIGLSNFISSKKTRMEESHINWAEILREKVHLQLPATWFTGNIAVWASRIFFRLYFRFTTTGIKNIPKGPFILAPNHQSWFDGMFVASMLKYEQVRGTYFYAKEKHLRKRWLRFLANRNNIIVMDMNRDLKESIQKMGEVLKRHKSLIIFPEGTRTLNGKMGEFKKTFAILSRELNVPVVPVSISGAFEALPSGKKFPRPWKKIRVEILEPVYPGDHSYESLAQNVRGRIEQKQQMG